MTRRNHRRLRTPRFHRIERLENRHLLSADGFEFEVGDDDLRALYHSPYRAHEVRHSDRAAEHHRRHDKDHERHQRDDDSHRRDSDRLQRRHDREHHRHRHDPPSTATFTYSRFQQSTHLVSAPRVSISIDYTLLTPPPRGPASPPPLTGGFESSANSVVRAATARDNTFPLTNEVTGPAADPTSPDSAANLPEPPVPPVPIERADSGPAVRPESALNQEANVPSDAVQLVSFTSHDVSLEATDAIEVIGNELRKSSEQLPGSGLPSEARAIDLALADRWLDQRDQLEEKIAELDQLLDAIVSERDSDRTANRLPRLTAESLRTDSARGDSLSTRPGLAEHGMILLLPTMVTDGSARFASQAISEVDEGAIGQWSVGIGMHRALQLAGGNELVDALATSRGADSEISDAEAADFLERFALQLPETPPVLASPPGQALGIFLCGPGIQYLRQRRRLPSDLPDDRFIVMAGAPDSDDEDS